MGCFAILKSRKKKDPPMASKKQDDSKERTPARLPEPESRTPSLQSAPPSFRNRPKISQPANKISNSRMRVLSAPSSLVVPDQDPLSSAEFDDQEEAKGRRVSIKEHRFSNPIPLPLPSPSSSPLKNMGSFKLSNASGPLFISGPLPLPPEACIGLRNFSYEEVSSACQHFSLDNCVSDSISSTVYKATFRDDSTGLKKAEATVTRLPLSSQGLREFVDEVNTLASLQHPNLCKLLGFHAQEGSNERMLVYEKLYHGSLDRLLYGRSEGPSIDWSTRMKVALGAARGLAFLHDEGPFQAMYIDFSASNIQIDKDYTAKLSGYGCVNYSDREISNTFSGATNLSVETLEKGLLTPKSNVWSLGIVLLELLTGRKNLDARYLKEERNIVKWSRPFLTDDCRLSLILDPRMKGRFPPKAARTVADVILKCFRKDPSERPTMRAIVDSLANVQDMKCPCCYPLQEPSVAVSKKVMLKSPSLNVIIPQHHVINLEPSPPSRNQQLLSPRSSLSSLPIPRRACAPIITLEDPRLSDMRKPSSPILHRRRIEGF